MKTSAIAAALAPAAFAHANPWWGGAPECAQNCFSSYWSTATSDSNWPAPTSYCGAQQAGSVASCLSSACSATPTAVTSYSSLSSSICAKWSSCTSAGSTSVYTVSLPAFTGDWGPGSGNWGGPGGHHGGDHSGPRWGWAGGSSGATATWTGGVYTVTGCEWDGSPWAGGPGGWGAGGGRGGSPWGPWGKGWDWSTETKTITQTVQVTSNGVTVFSTSTGLATVAQAVSGESTTSTVLTGAQETGPSQPNAAAGGMGGPDAAVKVIGALLGAGVVIVAGLL